MDSKPSMSAASSHGLFGMLPAPSRKGPPTPPRKRQEDEDEGEGVGEARLTLQEDEDDGRAQKGAKKGNADFRAMLGLKPIQSAGAGPSKPKEMAASVTSSRQPEPSRSVAPIKDSLATASKTVASTASSSTSTAPASEQAGPTSTSQPQPSQAPIDFFSLSSSSSNSHSAPIKPTVPSSSSSRLAVSSAPTIAEASPYAGWHQNPDGSWVPVTPEAIQAYEAHQASLTVSPQHAGGDARGAEEAARELRKLREQGIDVDSLQSVDLEATRAEWERKPVEARSAALDAKYAAAAGLPSQQGGAGVGGDDEDEDGAGAGRGERRKKGELPGAKNARGKGRGQLSNLIAQAAERKDELEQKWADGKSNRAAASNRYGW